MRIILTDSCYLEKIGESCGEQKDGQGCLTVVENCDESEDTILLKYNCRLVLSSWRVVG